MRGLTAGSREPVAGSRRSKSQKPSFIAGPQLSGFRLPATGSLSHSSYGPESQMFFRNLTFFRFPTSLDLSEFETQLATCALKPVGALELSSRGFISPFGRDAEALSHRIGDAKFEQAPCREGWVK